MLHTHNPHGGCCPFMFRPKPTPCPILGPPSVLENVSNTGDASVQTAKRKREQSEDTSDARSYPKLPPVAKRIKGTVYITNDGLYKKWGGKKVRGQCQNHPEIQAHYKDKDGNSHRLCGQCADKAGTKHVVQPCQNHPGTEAHYKDEDGNSHRLCGPCADKAGTKHVQHPCQNHPGTGAHYKDEDGNPYRLCGQCAEEAGTKHVIRPCQNHPEIQAHYKDKDGNPYRLCGQCAVEEGLKAAFFPGASMVACECWHRLEHVSNARLTHHLCCLDPTKWTGEEKKGLIPGRQHKPDAYIEPDLPIHLPGQTSGSKGAVYLFHGNEWHGYPPDHSKHKHVNLHGIPYQDLYEATLKQHELYRSQGYRVFVVWEHEYKLSTGKCPVHIQKVVCEV